MAHQTRWRDPPPGPQTSSAFFAECWEKAPRVFKATPARAALTARLTTLPSLLAWVRDVEAAGDGESPLMFGRDVNAARYRDGARETPSNGLGEAGSADLQALHDDEGCTLQVRARLGGGRYGGWGLCELAL
jgi:hypothetical protein